MKQYLKGDAFLVRYADDAIIGVQSQRDAHRIMEVLPKRFAKFGLRLHPAKTRLIWFGPPWKSKPCQVSRVRSFDFLGFTHHWEKSLKGIHVVMQKTAKDRLARAIHTTRCWIKRNRHNPLEEQQQGLCRKLRGHYAYYGVSGNYPALSAYYEEVRRIWMWALERRSHQKRHWKWFLKVLEKHRLDRPRIVHASHRR